MTIDAAETIALRALAFIASDAARLTNFTGQTGISLDDLHQRAGERETLAGALEMLMQDEAALLMFSANAGLPPEDVTAAAHALSPSAATD